MDTATTSTPSRPSARSKYPRRYSKAVKNGGKLKLQTLATLDGRTLAAKHAEQKMRAMERDLAGGAELSTGAKELIQHACVLSAMIESDETAWMNGKPVDVPILLAAINAQRRVLSTLGLERRARTVNSKSLDDILAELNAEKAAATTIIENDEAAE
jgi:hypothetical protein